VIAGNTRSSWHLNMTVPARDLAYLVPALKAWLEDLDEQPLRPFVASPPPLNAPPRPGESWQRPTVESAVAFTRAP
jgi:hypothetical protein